MGPPPQDKIEVGVQVGEESRVCREVRELNLPFSKIRVILPSGKSTGNL